VPAGIGTSSVTERFWAPVMTTDHRLAAANTIVGKFVMDMVGIEQGNQHVDIVSLNLAQESLSRQR
jgi:hypothetical protein